MNTSLLSQPTMQKWFTTDPELLEELKEMKQLNQHPDAYILKAIRHYKSSLKTQNTVVPQDSVCISKADLKKMSAEWDSFLLVRENLIRPLNSFKPKTFIKVCEEHSDIIRDRVLCPHCKLPFASKISLGLHDRKCQVKLKEEMTPNDDSISNDEINSEVLENTIVPQEITLNTESQNKKKKIERTKN
jgi:hypothetical protein